MKDRRKIRLVFAALLLLGVLLDLTEKRIGEDGRIRRGETDSDTEQYLLELDAEDVLRDYPYTLNVSPRLPDAKELCGLLEEAKQEIDSGFCAEGQTLSEVSGKVRIGTEYAQGQVEALWQFDPDGIVDEEGRLDEAMIPQEGRMVSVQVSLRCYGQQEEYCFSFYAVPGRYDPGELLLRKLRTGMQKQMETAGEDYVTLPSEIDGIALSWSSPRSHYARNILLLELLLTVGLVLVRREREREALKLRQRQMQIDYPGIVSKLLLLTGAGMSLATAWDNIAASYAQKRKNYNLEKRYAYEVMEETGQMLKDGLSEQSALCHFGDQIGLTSYRRLCRLLTEMLQKGARGMEQQMEAEAAEAFEARKRMARQLGEEAGTKLLLPMILMLAVVMAIIMVPALMSL